MGIRKKIAGENPRIASAIIAGGGTGGHLFPGIAVAEELRLRNPGCRIVFVSSGRPLEERVLSASGFEKAVIPVEGIKGRGTMAKLKSLAMLPPGFARAVMLLLRIRPDVVVGMGGYSAGPVVLGAWMFRFHRVICEQNRLPGITNRILARFAQRVYVSFPDTFDNIPAEKRVLTGNPVRRRIREALIAGDNGGSPGPDPSDRFTVLILGGSQGAHGINAALVHALDELGEKAHYHFIHQSGTADADAVAAAYREKGFSAVVAPFFEDMAEIYRGADLVICRAGATTVAEIAVAGKAAIFVPFPHAADDHQMFNALHLVEAGAAEMIPEKDLSGKDVAEKIAFYRRDHKKLTAMQVAMKEFGRPDAARKIIDDISRLVK